MTSDSYNRDMGVTMGNAWAWSVRLVCTDKGGHPSRELGLLTLWDDPEMREAYREAGISEGDIEALSHLEDVQAAATRISKRGDSVTSKVLARDSAASKIANRHVAEQDALNYPAMRFHCPSCGRDIRLTGRTLRRIVVGLAVKGVSRLDASHMHAILESS